MGREKSGRVPLLKYQKQLLKLLETETSPTYMKRFSKHKDRLLCPLEIRKTVKKLPMIRQMRVVSSEMIKILMNQIKSMSSRTIE
jgi:hypothetical protein